MLILLGNMMLWLWDLDGQILRVLYDLKHEDFSVITYVGKPHF
jgi:hypothetical protein